MRFNTFPFLSHEMKWFPIGFPRIEFDNFFHIYSIIKKFLDFMDVLLGTLSDNFQRRIF